MRFIHIADVHLGARPDAGPLYSEGRARELWETFEHVLGVCEEERTDLLLIAGDLFHRQPLVRELKEADYLFSELTHTGGVRMCIRSSGRRCSMRISRSLTRRCTA